MEMNPPAADWPIEAAFDNITRDKRFLSLTATDERPAGTGQLTDDSGPVHMGFFDLHEDSVPIRKFWYYPDEGMIHFDEERGSMCWEGKLPAPVTEEVQQEVNVAEEVQQEVNVTEQVQQQTRAAQPAPPVPSTQGKSGPVVVNHMGATKYVEGQGCQVTSDPYGGHEEGEKNPTDDKPIYKDRRTVLVLIICCCCCLIGGLVLITTGIRDEGRLSGECYKYQKMSNGHLATCTTVGLSAVTTEGDCRAASRYLGLPQGDPFLSDRQFCSQRPVGCYYADTKDKIFWNDCSGHLTPTDTTRQIVCKGAPEPYVKNCQHEEYDINSGGVAGIVLLALMCLPCLGLIVLFLCMKDACCEGKQHGGMHSGWRGGGGGGCGGCGGGSAPLP